MRAIQLYCDLVSGAVLDGLQAELAASGVDVGARADIPAMDFVEPAAGEYEVEDNLAPASPSEPEPAAAGSA
jgi:small subunit ribosomal protein S2